MKHSVFAIVLSMTAVIHLVNASAEDLPIGNHSPHKAALKDSVKEKANELSQLIALLLKTGDDDQLPAVLSPMVGLTGTPATKGRDFTLPLKQGKERRECTIVLAADSQDSAGKRPSCIYIQHKIVSGNDSEANYYRFSPNGKLEYAAVNHGKFDNDGKPVPGSGVKVEKDINSPEVQKAFKSELAYWTKDWVKQEKKALDSAKNSGSASKEAPAAAPQ